jgi:multidrug efflux system outer membrane protein
MSRRALALPLATWLSLAACTVGPDYERPPVDAPKGYKGATAEDVPSRPIDREWWKLFGDPALNSLEEKAIQANPDIQAALARVTEARAAARITSSQLYPTATLSPLAQHEHFSANSPRTGKAGGKTITLSDFQLPIDFGYEVDVWGKVRRSIESASAQTRATEDDYVVVLQGVQADLAQDYFSLRSLDSQQEILKRTVDLLRQQLALLETQFKAGLVGRITIVQQEAQLYSTMTLEVDVRRVRADTEHAIAILIGKPPSELTLPASPLNVNPPKVPAGLPAELLRHRPDVAEAERLLAGASAQIGVAVSQYYPDFRLTAQIGLESLDLRHLFEWQSRIWTIAATAATPLFTGGQIDATVAQAKGRYTELLANYRSRVLAAFRDVEDSLADLTLRAEASEAQAKAVSSSREYVALSETQFRQGLISYLQVTDSQRTLLTNELALAQLLNQRFLSTVLLVKALGAGWDEEAPPAIPGD